MTDTETAYDRLWQTTWGDIQQVGPVHRHIHQDLARVVAGLDGVQSVLDVGCGSGEALALLAENLLLELHGTDVSGTALKLAQSRLPRGDFRQLNIEQERLPETFDLVVSVQVVEHIADDVAALRNIAAMSSRYVFTSTMAGRMRRSEAAIGHQRNYTRAELVRKHEQAGLEVVWVRGWGFPFYSPLYRSAVEWLPGGPPGGMVGAPGRLVADVLYQLYRLNMPGRGDVISVLAKRP